MILITESGMELLREAVGTDKKVVLAKAQLSDSQDNISVKTTSLTGVKHTVEIKNKIVDGMTTHLLVEVKHNEGGDGYYIRRIGILTDTDELFAIVEYDTPIQKVQSFTEPQDIEYKISLTLQQTECIEVKEPEKLDLSQYVRKDEIEAIVKNIINTFS